MKGCCAIPRHTVVDPDRIRMKRMNDVVNTNHQSLLAGAPNLSAQVIDGQERCPAVARASAAGASFDARQCGSGFPVGWLRNRRTWITNHLARAPGIDIPPSGLAAERPQANPASTPEARVHALATVRLRNGDEFVVAIDAKNEAYLYACLGGSSDSARVAWFQTTDGCLIGLNLAHINAIFWSTPGSAAPKATAWDHDRLVVHFTDTPSIELGSISGDDIERLRQATISKHHATAFHTLRGRQNDPVSISIDTMTYITLPAVWLDEDP
jgi:hypothetical protein